MMEEVSTTSQTGRSGTSFSLNVLVGYRPLEPALQCGKILPEKTIKIAGSNVHCVEYKDGSLSQWFLAHADWTRLIAVEYDDSILNLPPFVLASVDQSHFSMIANEIVVALREDIATSSVSNVSIALSWPRDSFLVTLSMSGDSVVVADLLEGICNVVDVSLAPSAWIEPLKELVSRVSNQNSVLDDDRAEVQPPGVLKMRHVDNQGGDLQPSRTWEVQPASP